MGSGQWKFDKGALLWWGEAIYDSDSSIIDMRRP